MLRATKQDRVWDLDSLEQYGRQNCLLFHGAPKPPQGVIKRENTDAAVIEIMTNKLGIRVKETGRIGGKKRSVKPRPIIIKFRLYQVRAKGISK